MCTVAFVPDGSGGYTLGHNRDELITRSRGLPPAKGERDGRSFLAPRDPDGGGTWLAVNDRGVTLALLNAAEAAGRTLPDKPRSRGLVVWETLSTDGIDSLARVLGDDPVRFRAMRAFRLVAVERGPRLASMTWDGEKVLWEETRERTMFVSSSFGPAALAEARAASWSRFLEGHPSPGDDAVLAWLAEQCLRRPEAGTRSRTMVRVDAREARVRYTDGPPDDPASETHFARIDLVA